MMKIDKISEAQRAICKRFDSIRIESPSNLKVGVSRSVRDGVLPLNGLRHPPTAETTGWFIWAGEAISQEDDFFAPLHVEHLKSWCPEVLPYLGLPPGWRFLLAPGYEDVWFDPTLLEID